MNKEELKAEIAKKEAELKLLYQQLRALIYAHTKNIQSGENNQF